MATPTRLEVIRMIINELIRALQDAARYGDIKAAAFLPMLLDWARGMPRERH